MSDFNQNVETCNFKLKFTKHLFRRFIRQKCLEKLDKVDLCMSLTEQM